ncbi:MAG: hypothetical protein IPG60_13025 [Bacteroidetes bacterium]|nr:hypothetical protein [Bacteroidota bacterium]
MAGGHAVSLSPDGKHGYMGTSGQHLALYDPHSLNELDRITTLNLEINDTSIRGSTLLPGLIQLNLLLLSAITFTIQY